MANPFVAEIRIFPFNFAPKGWAFCDGQLMPISQNTALFSLLGTTYGGDGKSTFALPNLQTMAPIMWGQGAGLSLYDLGQSSGTEAVTLLDVEMPAHGHTLQGLAAVGNRTTPVANTIARVTGATPYRPPAGSPLSQMAFQALTPAGGSLPHNNMMPYVTFNFCIALQGVFPPRG